MSIIVPLIPQDKLIIIAVQPGCVMVSRYIQAASFIFEVQAAANWEDLESAAIRAVADQIGAIVEDGHYECPPDLAERAKFS